TKSDREMRRLRGKRIAMILQDPMASLNPLFTVGDQVAESLRVHEGASRRTAWSRARELLTAVKIPAPEARVREYPHQLSGGMRQRIVGAIAISCEPKLLIADEPTTSLDVTIQAQYLNLLRELQREHGLALIFITHNLGIVARMCDRVAVMYAGRLVEIGPVRRIFDSPAHPYTRALLESIPRLADSRARLTAIDGQPPDLAAAPTSGTLRFEGADLQTLDAAGRRRYRRSVQAVFQDPFASLNPRMRVGAIITEPLVVHEKLGRGQVREHGLRLLDLVGLPERSI